MAGTGTGNRAPRFDATASLPDARPTVSGGKAGGGSARAGWGGDDETVGRAIEAAKDLRQGRDTHAETVFIPARPSKPRLDKYAKLNLPTGTVAVTVLVAVSVTDTVYDTAFVT